MENTEPKTVLLKDYRPSDYLIDETRLRFELEEEGVQVSSLLRARRNPVGSGAQQWRLDGVDLELLNVALNGEPLSPNQYRQEDDHLLLFDLPEFFDLEIVTSTKPQHNTRLEGLYRSGDAFCTQCEAEGFRYITYYADRPDVLSKYTTTIVADADRYPVLLSNGNMMSKRLLDSGRTEVIWQDPFPKPCYLFALVAGKLERLEDSFTTMSGRQVRLQILTEPHNVDKLDFAMHSLKAAMRWDEEQYGREYDLDIFMIVAVDTFNAGAMENKGLNIFNSACLLASPQTTTDAAFQRVETVVGHEYFHNWSGNRVTCRDWFQLSLKEGFTVFRDSEFSADMGSRTVKRIQDAGLLRSSQFPEDAGPMAHPVQPSSYMQITNFYTLTVYEKGAELVRMLQQLLSPTLFRKGCDLYFAKHDGTAVTIEEFVRAMEEVSGMDLQHFRLWYSQAGTPRLRVRDHWLPDAGEYHLEVHQHTEPTPGQACKQPLHIPLVMGLLDRQGRELLGLSGADSGVTLGGTVRCKAAEEGGSLVAHIDKESQTLVFGGLRERPVPSLLRGFSAPVILDFQQDLDSLEFLVAHDKDGFSRWDAAQELGCRALLPLARTAESQEPLRLGAEAERLISVYGRVLESALGAADDGEQKAVLAEILTLPMEQYLVEKMHHAPVLAIHRARRFLRVEICRAHEQLLRDIYARCRPTGPYSPDGIGIARRSLRNLCLSYLALLEDGGFIGACAEQYRNADNMTDRNAALTALTHCLKPAASAERDHALADFAQRFRDEALAMDLWFSIQATTPASETLETVQKLTGHQAFNGNNPNKIRALIGALAQRNTPAFHRDDGAGYSFLAGFVLDLDTRNPQLAARLVMPLAGNWRKYEPWRQQRMREQLEAIRDSGKLSDELNEVVTKALEEPEAREAQEPGEPEAREAKKPGEREERKTKKPGEREERKTKKPGEPEEREAKKPGEREERKAKKPGEPEEREAKKPGEPED